MPWQLRALSSEEQAELYGLYIIEKELENYDNSEQARIAGL